jgi:serine protease autotransporter
MTRGSITGQVKALSMIVAMEGLIPDRRAVSSPEKKSPPAPAPQIYASAWLRGQATTPATTNNPPPSPAPAQEEHRPACPGVPSKPEPGPGSAAEAPPDPSPSRSTIAKPSGPSEALPPNIPAFASVPDISVPFSIKKNPFARHR